MESYCYFDLLRYHEIDESQSMAMSYEDLVRMYIEWVEVVFLIIYSVCFV